MQMEEAFQERQQAVKEKREFERMAQSLSDCPKGDKGSNIILCFYLVKIYSANLLIHFYYFYSNILFL